VSERESGGPIGSNEFTLAAECCRRAFKSSSYPAGPPPEKIDWTLLLRLARFHRIEGLVWSGLAPHRGKLPNEVSEQLQVAASEVAANNLRALQDCRNLQDAFERAKIPLLFLKGLSLGALAYGNPTIKSSIDIDLLIAPEDLLLSAAVLRRCGYRLVAPAGSGDDRLLVRWHRGWKESVWRDDRTRAQIDLHTRTADNPRLIPTIDVRSPSQQVEIGNGLTLPTLADEQLFAYLAVHGASSAWFRLKWIADFAGFLSGKASRIGQFYHQSQELGAGHAAGQALLLADELFGTLAQNSELRATMGRDPATSRLFRTALGLLRRNAVEPTSLRWGTLPIHSTQLLLLPGIGYKMSEVSRQVRRLIDRPPA
jgi:hypothetical protein